MGLICNIIEFFIGIAIFVFGFKGAMILFALGVTVLCIKGITILANQNLGGVYDK